MERLWAPWRMRYILEGSKTDGCIFCDKWKSDSDAEDLILCRGARAFAMMNLFPYNNGHLLILPVRHIGDLLDLSPDEQAEMFSLLQQTVAALRNAMDPHGFNIGFNLGVAAGAGIADHLHLHVVPRWKGDTNFMPVVGATRVISEAIEQTYKKLKAAMSNEQ